MYKLSPKTLAKVKCSFEDYLKKGISGCPFRGGSEYGMDCSKLCGKIFPKATKRGTSLCPCLLLYKEKLSHKHFRQRIRRLIKEGGF